MPEQQRLQITEALTALSRGAPEAMDRLMPLVDPTDDLREQLQKTLGASYTLERELGGGGMSRVFGAEETTLGRRVVLKVLPPKMSLHGDPRWARLLQLPKNALYKLADIQRRPTRLGVSSTRGLVRSWTAHRPVQSAGERHGSAPPHRSAVPRVLRCLEEPGQRRSIGVLHQKRSTRGENDLPAVGRTRRCPAVTAQRC